METKKLDKVSLGVVVVYIAQKSGLASINEIVEIIKDKMHGDVSRKEVKNAVLSAQKKGLLSVNYDDDRTEKYSTTSVKWAKAPEIAHLKTLLDPLLATDEAREISKILQGQESDTTDKKPRLLPIRDYVHYEIEYEAVLPILGGEPAVEEVMHFRRVNGKIWFPLNLWMKPAVELNLRMKGVAGSKLQYLRFSNVYLDEKIVSKKVEARPVEIDGKGNLTKHERIDEGLKFKVIVSFPTEGFMSEEDFLWCLDDINVGSKHKDFGLLKLISKKKLSSPR